jgi:hypothetical protein
MRALAGAAVFLSVVLGLTATAHAQELFTRADETTADDTPTSPARNWLAPRRWHPGWDWDRGFLSSNEPAEYLWPRMTVGIEWFNGRMEPELGNVAGTTVIHFFNPSAPSIVLTSVAWSTPALYPLSSGDLGAVRDQLNTIVDFGSTMQSWMAGFAPMSEGQQILALGAISSLVEPLTYTDARSAEETTLFLGDGSKRFTTEQMFTSLKVAFVTNTDQPLGF